MTALDSLNRAATTADPQRTSPYEMWYEKEPSPKNLPFFTSCFDRKARLGKEHLPRCSMGCFFGPYYSHPRPHANAWCSWGHCHIPACYLMGSPNAHDAPVVLSRVTEDKAGGWFRWNIGGGLRRTFRR